MTDYKIMKGNKPVTSDNIYDMMFKYLGYGNPAGKYWFIGMEENWDLDCVNDIRKIISVKDIEYYSQQMPRFGYIKCEFKKRASGGRTFERGIKRIITDILQFGDEEIDSVLSNDVFITNSTFIPINKKYIEEKINLFDTTFENYETDLKEYRKELNSLWLQNEHITFCLSSEYIDDFLKIFGLESDNVDPIKIPRNRKNWNWEFKRIKNHQGLTYQLYHPSYPSFDAYITDIKRRLVQEIREYSKDYQQS